MGTGCTPNSPVALQWADGSLLTSTANNKGDITINTTASQIISNAGGQVGYNVGYDLGVWVLDNLSSPL